MNKAQIKTMGILFLLFSIIGFILVYAITSTLQSPSDNSEDNDGWLSLNATCEPTASDGTTSYNITNATLWTNADGTWKQNKTLYANATNDVASNANITYHFNFTNVINSTRDNLDVIWNVQCWEQNASLGTQINSDFGINRTVNVRYSKPIVTIDTPSANSYDLDGNNISVTCSAENTNNEYNFTNISLYTNIGSGWTLNDTFTPTLPDNNIRANFTINQFGNSSLRDGLDVLFSCVAIMKNNNSLSGDEPLVLSESAAANRTLNIEYPPNIELYYPPNGGFQSAADTTVNFTPTSAFTTGTGFVCQFITNESGGLIVQRTLTGTNNTNTTLNYQFENGQTVAWAVKCFEASDTNVVNSSINFTVRVDRTSPSITLTHINESTLVNYSYFRAKRLTFNFTVTEANPNMCDSYINETKNVSYFNISNVEKAVKNFSVEASDGIYTVRVGCNDTAGNYINSSNVWFVLDTLPPQINNLRLINESTAHTTGLADARFFNFTSNEDVNFSIDYGTTTAKTSRYSNSSFHRIQNATIYGFLENTLYYWNLTACDRAGNCNGSSITYGDNSFTFPWQLRTGWSYYGIYDAQINFSRILNETEAEFVYYWNQTGQGWVSATAGGTSNMGFEVGTAISERGSGGRHVVALFESTNSTWTRNTTSSTNSYIYNFTTGDNFIKLSRDYTFGNLSLSLFNNTLSWHNGSSFNAGYGFGVEESTTPSNLSTAGDENRTGTLKYNITDFWFSAYNNTANTWTLSYTYNFTFNNNTVITPASRSEVVWIFSLKNLTWNTTNIIGNWSY